MLGEAGYGAALAGIVVYALFGFVLGPLSAIRKDKGGLPPGASHRPDYADPDYRLDRSYLQTVESLAYLAPVMIAAILAGANPALVGFAVWGCVVLRLAVTVVYLRGLGKGYRGLRTNLVIVHNVFGLALVLLTLVALF